MRPHRLSSAGHRRRSPCRSRVANLESCEPRVLLSGSAGFLQGVVYLSGTSQGLAGATVQLESLPSGAIVQTVTTGANGVYLFQNLPSGEYRLTETPPAGYVNDTLPVQADSPLTPLSNTDPASNSVDVQLGDPSQLLLSYASHNKEQLYVTNNGQTHDSLVGQLNLSVTHNDITSTATFPSFCVDFFRDINTGNQNLPYSMQPLDQALAGDSQVTNKQNAGAIAYLYNTFGTTSITDTATAVGLQLAIWELEYEKDPPSPTYNVLGGTSYAASINSSSPLTPNSPEVQAAQNFLAQAQNYLKQAQGGQNELAVYLDGLPTTGRSTGSQGLIAPESLNFANQPNLNPNLPATLAGVVYVDVNNNGQYDNGTDTPLAGVVMTLTGTDTAGNAVDLTTTTLANGTYTFSKVPVSNAAGYTLTEAATPAYGEGTNTPGTPVDGKVSGDTISRISVASGAVLTNYNFGEVTGSLTGVVYVDINNNGQYDSGTDAPVSGVPMTLTGTDINGNPVDLTTTAAANGTYDFTGLLASNGPGYSVTRAPAVSPYVSATNTPGTPVNGTVSTVAISSISFVGGANLVNYNFGQIVGTHPALPITLGGTLFAECDNDGIQQACEPGVAGITMTLAGFNNSGQLVNMVTTTNSLGQYTFNVANPGTYVVSEGATPGYIQGKDTSGTAGGTVSGDSISHIVLTAGMNATGYNFALLHPGSLSGYVYYDLNHNGVMDTPDYGIAHVTVTLEGTNDLGRSIRMTTVTNDDGFYSFGGLRPGTYEIIRTHPAIFVDYQNNVGSLGGAAENNSISSITLPPCGQGVNYNFGELQTKTCNLRNLAISVGNLFYHFERSYQASPATIARHYPKLVPYLAADRVPFGIAPFPKAALASYWVPELGTKPIKVYPVKGVSPAAQPPSRGAR